MSSTYCPVPSSSRKSSRRVIACPIPYFAIGEFLSVSSCKMIADPGLAVPAKTLILRQAEQKSRAKSTFARKRTDSLVDLRARVV
jgi:hypothetical protein